MTQAAIFTEQLARLQRIADDLGKIEAGFVWIFRSIEPRKEPTVLQRKRHLWERPLVAYKVDRIVANSILRACERNEHVGA